jgi:hypothetical protein
MMELSARIAQLETIYNGLCAVQEETREAGAEYQLGLARKPLFIAILQLKNVIKKE